MVRSIPKEPGPWKHNPRASCMDGTVIDYDLPRVWVFFFFNDDGDRPEVEDLRRGETVEIQQSSQLQFR